MQNREEVKKILAVADKYQQYFEEWKADIALGRKGLNFFYVMDEVGEGFDVFCSFKTAEELETLIIGDIASNVNTCLYAGTESVLQAFDSNVVNDAYDNFFPETSIRNLVRQMKALSEENAKWFDLMQKTFRSLGNIVAEPEK